MVCTFVAFVLAFLPFSLLLPPLMMIVVLIFEAIIKTNLNNGIQGGIRVSSVSSKTKRISIGHPYAFGINAHYFVVLLPAERNLFVDSMNILFAGNTSGIDV